MVGLTELETKVLMELQYRFPIEPDPYEHIASSLGVAASVVFDTVRKLVDRGVVRRIGFYLNYRSLRMQAALVAFRAREPTRVHEEVSRRLRVTHSYLREHPVYNLWIVVRGSSRDSIRDAIAEASRIAGVDDYVILWGVRTYRLSVKFDLFRGVSRAGPFSEISPSPPRPEDLGYSTGLARSLQSLPLSRRPFRDIGAKHGVSEDYVLEAAKDMLRHGVLADPGATLNTEAVGIAYNAMFVLRPRNGVDGSTLCRWVLEHIPEATHVVEREPEPKGKFDYPCYFMAHARDPTLLAHIHRILEEEPIVEDYMVLPSRGRVGALEVRA